LRFLPVTAFGFSLLLLISACGDDGGGGSACVEEGEAEGILVTIGCRDPKTQPFYIWEEGGAFEIKVTRVSNDALAWKIFVPTLEDNITSPVIHGESRSGTLSEGDEIQLTPGVEYEVKVSRVGGTSGTRKFSIKPDAP
jgi:hypothetical protein